MPKSRLGVSTLGRSLDIFRRETESVSHPGAEDKMNGMSTTAAVQLDKFDGLKSLQLDEMKHNAFVPFQMSVQSLDTVGFTDNLYNNQHEQ